LEYQTEEGVDYFPGMMAFSAKDKLKKRAFLTLNLELPAYRQAGELPTDILTTTARGQL
jgi:hypothetical protein